MENNIVIKIANSLDELCKNGPELAQSLADTCGVNSYNAIVKYKPSGAFYVILPQKPCIDIGNYEIMNNEQYENAYLAGDIVLVEFEDTKSCIIV